MKRGGQIKVLLTRPFCSVRYCMFSPVLQQGPWSVGALCSNQTHREQQHARWTWSRPNSLVPGGTGQQSQWAAASLPTHPWPARIYIIYIYKYSFQDAAMLHLVSYRSGQRISCLGVQLDHFAPWQNLQDYDSEAVDVTGAGEVSIRHVLRIHVADGSSDVSEALGLLHAHHLR